MRVDLRLGDLRSRGQIASKLMNVKIPSEVNEKIQRVAETLKASKTEAVIALLNEGLDVSEGLLKGAPRGNLKAATVVRRGRRPTSGKACSAAGCNEKAVAKGFCPKHYQAARRRRMGK